MEDAEKLASPDFRYIAFISYSRKDRADAVRLQTRLERYVLPAALRANEATPNRRQPLRPIFRDEDELVPGQDLSARIQSGLEQSKYLVVLCSPNAAQSEWVEREIVEFTRLGRAANILAVVVSGNPKSGDPQTEALPRALRYTVDSDGLVTDIPSDPLWADWRKGAQRERSTFLRIVASLLTLKSLDDLIQRDAKARRQRSILNFVMAGATLLLAAVAVLFWMQGQREEERTQRNLEAAQTFMSQNVATLTDPTSSTQFGSEQLQLRMLRGLAPQYEHLVHELGESDPRAQVARARAALALGNFAADQSSMTEAIPFLRTAYDSVNKLDAPTIARLGSAAVHLNATASLSRQLVSIGSVDEGSAILDREVRRFGVVPPAGASDELRLAYISLAIARVEAFITKNSIKLDEDSAEQDSFATESHKKLASEAAQLQQLIHPLLDSSRSKIGSVDSTFYRNTLVIEAALVTVKAMRYAGELDKARTFLTPVLNEMRPLAATSFNHNRVWSRLYLTAEQERVSIEFEALRVLSGVKPWKIQRDVVLAAMPALAATYKNFEPQAGSSLWFLQLDHARRVTEFELGLLSKGDEDIVAALKNFLAAERQLLSRDPTAVALQREAAGLTTSLARDVSLLLAQSPDRQVEACGILFDFEVDLVTPATEPVYRGGLREAAQCVIKAPAAVSGGYVRVARAARVIRGLGKLISATQDQGLRASQLETAWTVISALANNQPASMDVKDAQAATALADAWDASGIERTALSAPFNSFQRYRSFVQQAHVLIGYLIGHSDSARALRNIKIAASVGNQTVAMEIAEALKADNFKSMVSPREIEALKKAARRLPRFITVQCTNCLPDWGKWNDFESLTPENRETRISKLDYFNEQISQHVVFDEGATPSATFNDEVAFRKWLRPGSDTRPDFARQIGFCAAIPHHSLSCEEAMLYALNIKSWMMKYSSGATETQEVIKYGQQAATLAQKQGLFSNKGCDYRKIQNILDATPFDHHSILISRFRRLEVTSCRYYDIAYIQNHLTGLYRPALSQWNLDCADWLGQAYGPKVAPTVKCKPFTELATRQYPTANSLHRMKEDPSLLQEKVVIVLQGKNVYGVPIYTYLRLSLKELKRLRDRMVTRQDFSPEDYGQVLFADKGAPSLELRRFLAYRHNMIDVPRPSGADTPKAAGPSLSDWMTNIGFAAFVADVPPPGLAPAPANDASKMSKDSAEKYQLCDTLSTPDHKAAASACSDLLERSEFGFLVVFRAYHNFSMKRFEAAISDAQAGLNGHCQQAAGEGAARANCEALASALLVEIYAQKKDLAAIDKVADALSRSSPDTSATGSNSACYYHAVLNKALDRGLAFCNRALALKPSKPEYLDSRGFVYYRMGRYADAIADYDAALRIDASLAPSLFVRGAAKKMLGDISGAAADIATAKRTDPTIGDQMAKMGVIF